MSFENQLLQFMSTPDYLPMKQHEIARLLGIESKDQRHVLRQTLRRLEESEKIIRLRKNRWALPNTDNEKTGTLQIMAGGGAIFIPDDSEQDEIYIADKNLGVALPNDKVSISAFHSEYASKYRSGGSASQRAEGKVTKVLERANQQVVGVLKHTPYYSYVIPDAKSFKHDVRVENAKEIPDNHKVIVKLNNWVDPYKPLTGSITEDLGSNDTPGIDVDSLLKDAGIEEEFPAEVIAEANKISGTITEEQMKGRRDLRDAVIFTIDPETAKDYDDAISLEPHPDGGWLLGVYIADVSTFVQPGSLIDKEAYKRGNSIYLVDRAVMMLPKELTTKVCSLNPQNDHLTHSVELHLSEDGTVLGYETFPAVIHSKARLTYNQVQEFIEKNENDSIPEIVIDRLKNLCPLVKKIRALRVENGSVEINTPEIEIKLNAKGKIEKMTPRAESKDAYQLIEECMLLANKAVAEILLKSGHPAIYRVHDEPDPEQWESMGMELQALGIAKLPRTRHEINEAIQLAIGTPVEYTANLAILRCFKRAEYASKQIGHFGLAFEDYTHFTSPIRRYSDLLVHRMLKGIETGHPYPISNEKIEAIAKHCNETEREADSLEKQSTSKKRMDYYKEILDRSSSTVFTGFVISIKGKGIIVELPDSLQRGMVTFASITSDWLEANATMTQAITRSGKARFTIGDKIQVCLAKVDTARGFLDFQLADQAAPKKRTRKKERIQPNSKGNARHYPKSRRRR